ncbi:MAG: large conductance mechanosensitive channel protein MscL [Actinocatenispora sp.]
MFKGFRDFILRGNVIDLAVGIVIGVAFNAVVESLVSSFITPLFAAIWGKHDFSKLIFEVNGSKFHFGIFVNAVISFVILAAVVYFLVVLPVNKLMTRFFPAKDVASPKRDCPECLSSIPAAASRCSFCTAQVAPVPAPVA